eukprot:scaffold15022_cov117-Isochrysis_galbana.AAC.3
MAGLLCPPAVRTLPLGAANLADVTVTVLGVELLRAIGICEDSPWPFFAVIKDVGLGIHSFEFEQEVG